VFSAATSCGIVLGITLLSEPVATVVALRTLLGFYRLITGVLAAGASLLDRSTPWVWSLLKSLMLLTMPWENVAFCALGIPEPAINRVANLNCIAIAKRERL
jgi:uncharacterized membrane protein HdeD (DUF308 family)